MAQVFFLSATSNNNFKLAQDLFAVFERLGGKGELVNLEDLNLPLYTPPEEEKGIPVAAKDLSSKLQKASGLVLIAPEYNGSIPPVMNNAIAWVSRTGGDWRIAFNGKVSVVATHSGGGGQKVTHAMRSQLEHLGCIVLPRPIIVNSGKVLNVESVKTIFEQLLQFITK